MSDVTQLGVTKEQIARIIQQIVKDSSSVFFTNESSLHEKDLVINRLQIFSCLKKGKVMTEPVKTNEGFVECEMYFFTAGQDVHVDVAVEYDDKQDRVLVVRKISKE